MTHPNRQYHQHHHLCRYVEPYTTIGEKEKPKVIRVFRSVFRSFPIITPVCKLPVLQGISLDGQHRYVSGNRVTGTLFGYRKGRVSLSIQESSKCYPSLIVELAIQTNVLQKELGSGMVRIALECEKRPDKDKVRLLDEPLWTMFCNGKKNGYGVKRDPTDGDITVMEILRAVSMGAGVLPGNSEIEVLMGSFPTSGPILIGWWVPRIQRLLSVDTDEGEGLLGSAGSN
ncbi:hypothetical protein GH714_037083 [Hevea brasiliensis]|uniref:Protein MIZU-KUSSEI 1 n=1 Tax=Hevea brasiliensis TaxID=3981 RepID=A0A6A6KWU4_HEVBR|nr:hypothetical protein GH714_037083 [Hevea brasiliensis]